MWSVLVGEFLHRDGVETLALFAQMFGCEILASSHIFVRGFSLILLNYISCSLGLRDIFILAASVSNQRAISGDFSRTLVAFDGICLLCMM